MLQAFIDERNKHYLEKSDSIAYDIPCFICSLCERATSYSESFSNGGENLVCVNCAKKIQKMLHIDQLTFLQALHDELMPTPDPYKENGNE